MATTHKVPRIHTALPGPKAQAILAIDKALVSPSYTRDYPLVVARGEGCWIEDVDGNLFLDMTAGIAVCATGHCHPRVVEAVRDQAGRLLHMSGTDFYYRSQVELAKKLVEMQGGGDWRVFFCNSGAEAVECAFKLVRWYTKRQLVIAFEGAFHGRTMGALSLSASKPVHREAFFPLVPGVYHVKYGDADAIERLLQATLPPSQLAAIFVEPIQGEGGYHVAPPGFLQRLRDICDRTGAVLVADEIQSGMGRTGRYWAYEHDGVVPDVICSAKGIASGMPLGVCLAKTHIMGWPPGSHASTFGGNPVSCRAALATLELLEEGLIDHAAKVGAFLEAKLREACAGQRHVTDVRGRGLMLAVELDEPERRNRVVQDAFRRGLLLIGCGKRAVRFAPALVISEEEAELAVSIFKTVLG